MLGTTLNFAAALAVLIAAWRWYQTTTIRPTELPYGGPTTIGAQRKGKDGLRFLKFGGSRGAVAPAIELKQASGN
jgi:hypothetical protein